MENIRITQQQRNVTVSEPRPEYHLPIASADTLGGIKVGNNLAITEDGVLSAYPSEYDLPIASANTLGGVKIGSGITVDINGSISVDVDNTMSSASENPVQNKVINSEITSINSDVTGIDNRLTLAEENISANTEAIGSNTTDISSLSDSVDDLSDSVTDISTALEGDETNISNNTTAISGLDDRLDTAESNIEDLQQGSNEMSSDITNLKLTTDKSVSYTSILPVSSWTAGSIALHRRGFVAFLFIQLEGSMLLGANASTTIYTFTDSEDIPLYETSDAIVTDAGSIILSVDDQGQVILTNPTATAMTITKVYGNVPMVF